MLAIYGQHIANLAVQQNKVTDYQSLIWLYVAKICAICRSFIGHICALHTQYISHMQPTVQATDGPYSISRKWGLVAKPPPPMFFIFFMVHLWPVL